MNEIVAPVERAAHAIGVRLSQLKLTQAEAHVLARLARSPASVSDLHRAFGHKRSTLTAVLDRLEAREYVSRRQNRADRRSIVVELTAAGRPAARKVLRAVRALEREVARGVTPADLAGFERVVAYLTRIESPNG